MGGTNCFSYEVYNPECDTWTKSPVTFEEPPGDHRVITLAVALQLEESSSINDLLASDYYVSQSVGRG